MYEVNLPSDTFLSDATVTAVTTLTETTTTRVVDDTIPSLISHRSTNINLFSVSGFESEAPVHLGC